MSKLREELENKSREGNHLADQLDSLNKRNQHVDVLRKSRDDRSEGDLEFQNAEL